MKEKQPSVSDGKVQRKSISIQERSVPIGDIIFVNGYGVNLSLLQQRFAQGGYTSRETPHFLLFTRAEEPKTILVHWFDPQKRDADQICLMSSDNLLKRST